MPTVGFIVTLLIILIAPVAVIALIVYVAMQRDANKTAITTELQNRNRERTGQRMLKSIYLYIVLFITLMMSIGGAIGVFTGIANIVAPDYYVEPYEQYRNARCDNNNYMTPYGARDAAASGFTSESADDSTESSEDESTEPAEPQTDSESDTSATPEIGVVNPDTSVGSSDMRIQPWPYPIERQCDEALLRDMYDDMEQDIIDDAKGQAIKMTIQSLGWIVIPLPIFIYFQRQLNRDSKRRDERIIENDKTKDTEL